MQTTFGNSFPIKVGDKIKSRGGFGPIIEVAAINNNYPVFISENKERVQLNYKITDTYHWEIIS